MIMLKQHGLGSLANTSVKTSTSSLVKPAKWPPLYVLARDNHQANSVMQSQSNNLKEKRHLPPKPMAPPEFILISLSLCNKRHKQKIKLIFTSLFCLQ